MPVATRIVHYTGYEVPFARIRVTDVHNGLRAFNRPAAQSLHITLDRMAHASEILDQIQAGGWRYTTRERREMGIDSTAPFYRISDFELASRLSFFLWSSIPDDELLEVAERGTLRDPTTLASQVRRMLSDDRARALVANFGGQWLYLRNMGLVSQVSELPIVNTPSCTHQARAKRMVRFQRSFLSSTSSSQNHRRVLSG